MAHFEVTVRFLDVAQPSASAAGHAIEERLRTAGFVRWQILKVGLQAAMAPVARVPAPGRSLQARTGYLGGGLLVLASAMWALWFLYLIAG